MSPDPLAAALRRAAARTVPGPVREWLLALAGPQATSAGGTVAAPRPAEPVAGREARQ
jgi:hypothetical protein